LNFLTSTSTPVELSHTPWLLESINPSLSTPPQVARLITPRGYLLYWWILAATRLADADPAEFAFADLRHDYHAGLELQRLVTDLVAVKLDRPLLDHA